MVKAQYYLLGEPGFLNHSLYTAQLLESYVGVVLMVISTNAARKSLLFIVTYDGFCDGIAVKSRLINSIHKSNKELSSALVVDGINMNEVR